MADPRLNTQSHQWRYYADAGVHAERIAPSALLSLSAIRTAMAEFESAGCDLLIMAPVVADPAQVHLLAEATRSQ